MIEIGGSLRPNSGYNAFLRSFKDGVELSSCNKEGFTPLTYAAHHGNLAMVKFLVKQGADCAGIDQRGYNALHTAIQAGARQICEMLLHHSPVLRTIPAMPNGRAQTIQEIIAQNAFQLWAEHEFA